MTLPDVWQIYDVTQATWPPAATWPQDGWTIRDGAGGGKRVSAATLADPQSDLPDIAAAEAAMRQLGQTPLFMIREGETQLDSALSGKGYAVIDPVNLYAIPISALIQDAQPGRTTFAIWEPLQIQREIWADGDIGPKRVDVMARAAGPKTSLFGRTADRPAATAFVAISDGIAMVHALEVRSFLRRSGLGHRMMQAAGLWAAQNGAQTMTVLCTQANAAANGLYTSLGMALVGQYHYRIHPAKVAT